MNQHCLPHSQIPDNIVIYRLFVVPPERSLDLRASREKVLAKFQTNLL